MGNRVIDRIRRYMGERDMSQRMLARESGLSQSTISRVLDGKRAASAPEVLRMAWALGVHYADLTEEDPLPQRVRFAARADEGADLAPVMARIVEYMRMRRQLDSLGIPVGR